MRNKTNAAFLEDIQKEAEHIVEDFSQFTFGTRALFLLCRNKGGGHTNEFKRRLEFAISHNKESLQKHLEKLLVLKHIYGDNYRIYMSACPRDISKAEKEFKSRMLDCDFAGKESKQFFYERLPHKWASSLMASRPMKNESLFVLDIDTPTNDDALKWISKNNVAIVKSYQTKNGWHIVTLPFDRTKFPKEIGEVKGDGLLLLKF